MNRFLITAALLAVAVPASAEELPIFDAHIHYSHDAVKLVPPAQIANILREAGVKKALVSSSDDDGTQKLLAAAPDIIVASLRPYRRRGETRSWVNDPGIIDYLEDRLSRFEYEAIGEFHAFGDDIDTPVLQRMIELARERDLLLHHHGDRAALDKIFKTWPEARVLWAHSGFEDPKDVADALATYPALWSDLAFRSEVSSRGGIDPDWRKAFEAYPDRFMVGTDTFAPERWYYVGPHAANARSWLATLAPDVARKIAFENAQTMIASRRYGRCAPSEGAKNLTAENSAGPKAFLQFTTPPVSEPFGMELLVCGAGVSGVSIDAIMPAHQHGMNYEPKIEELGEGRFGISNMVFHMRGDWQVNVEASIGGEKQTYTLDIALQ